MAAAEPVPLSQAEAQGDHCRQNTPLLTGQRLDGAASKSRERRSQGQALVEFGLVLPILLVMFAAVYDFGRFYYASVVAAGAAREGARLGSDYSVTNAQIVERVRQAAQGYPISSVSITITPKGSSTSMPSASRTYRNSGDNINVTVTVQLQPLTPWTQAFLQSLGRLVGGQVPITVTASMEIF